MHRGDFNVGFQDANATPNVGEGLVMRDGLGRGEIGGVDT